MTSHLFYLALFSLLVSAVFGALQHDAPRQQLRAGALIAGGLLGAALLLGWLMYPLPL